MVYVEGLTDKIKYLKLKYFYIGVVVMYKTVSLEAVRKLVGKKVGKEIKIVGSTGGTDLFAFVDSDLAVKTLIFDMDANDSNPLICLDKGNKDISEHVHTILFKSGDLVKEVTNGIYHYKLRLDGAKNGILVIDDKLVDDADIKYLETVEGL